MIFPVLVPAITAALIVLAVSHDQVLTRTFSLFSSIALVIVSGLLFLKVNGGDIFTYSLGNWPYPFGIVLTLDRLSALMLVLSALTGLFVLLFSINGADLKGKHFHSLFQFQLMGINGAFLTGDLFNLFVFFEVLLIASYGLVVHGGGAKRVKAGLQYVMINLVGSALFLIAVGAIYGVVGTLNMADVATKASLLNPGDQAILYTGALLLLVVFSIKGALMPLHFWLPGTYSNAMAPVAALFALLTKVGVYSIIRVYTLSFGSAAGEVSDLVGPLLLPAALLTLIIGSLGVLAAKRLGQLVSFAAVASMGTIFIAVSQFTESSLASAIYYTLHSTFATALLFLIVHLVRKRRPHKKDLLELSSPFTRMGFIGSFYFIAAIAMAGMPPLSGFFGKLLILKSTLENPWTIAIWIVVLTASLLSIIGFSRAGSLLFWKSYSVDTNEERSEEPTKIILPLVSMTGLILCILILTFFAGPIMEYLELTSQQLLNPTLYIQKGGL